MFLVPRSSFLKLPSSSFPFPPLPFFLRLILDYLSIYSTFLPLPSLSTPITLFPCSYSFYLLIFSPFPCLPNPSSAISSLLFIIFFSFSSLPSFTFTQYAIRFLLFPIRILSFLLHHPSLSHFCSPYSSVSSLPCFTFTHYTTLAILFLYRFFIFFPLSFLPAPSSIISFCPFSSLHPLPSPFPLYPSFLHFYSLLSSFDSSSWPTDSH